jgi:hypothetical protein
MCQELPLFSEEWRRSEKPIGIGIGIRRLMSWHKEN